jgi:ribosomal protein S18 acetylase RimI-like enzyme
VITSSEIKSKYNYEVRVEYLITFQEDVQKQTKVLIDGLMRQAKEKKQMPPIRPFGFFIKDKKDQELGGIISYIFYGSVKISLFWITDKLRHRGYGTELMKKTIEYGLQNGCRFISVETMDWEALVFYKKLGFKLDFERRGYLNDSVFYYLSKSIV